MSPGSGGGCSTPRRRYVTAIFANSPLYDGEPTGYRSTRAAVWRALDPARTGLPWAEDDPVGAYLDFALAAPAMLFPTIGGEYRQLRRVAAVGPSRARTSGRSTSPPCSPRCGPGVTSSSAPATRCRRAWYAAPLALVVGITYDPGAMRAAAELLGAARRGLLERAGRVGLGDPLIGARRHGPGGHRAPRLRRPGARLLPPRRSGAGAGLLRLLHPAGPESGRRRGGSRPRRVGLSPRSSVPGPPHSRSTPAAHSRRSRG